jgi:glycine cleavage system H protein
MSAILALITAIILVMMGLIRSRKPRERPAPSIIERYVHPGHTWVRTTSDGYVVIGVDDFAQSLMGMITGIVLPRYLTHVTQGRTVLRLSHSGRDLSMLSPVSGWVVEKNEMVLNNPSLINVSPYGEGWLFKVKPYRLSTQLNNLLNGRTAHLWQDAARARLRQFFSGTPALTFQDGGVIVNDIADRCSDAEWKALTEEFFLAS